MSVKRIAVLTTSCSPPMMVKAVYKDGMLTIADPEILPPDRKNLFAKAIPILTKMVDKGFTVLVDERSQLLAETTGAKCVNFGSLSPKGTSVISVAFNTLREMKRQYAVLPPKKYAAAFDVPDSLVNEVHSPNGDISYKVDWENMRGEQYLVLLCAYAAQYNDVGSAAYIKEMMGHTEEKKPLTSPLHAIATHFLKEEEENRPKSLAGTRIDENSWYL